MSAGGYTPYINITQLQEEQKSAHCFTFQQCETSSISGD